MNIRDWNSLLKHRRPGNPVKPAPCKPILRINIGRDGGVPGWSVGVKPAQPEKGAAAEQMHLKWYHPPDVLDVYPNVSTSAHSAWCARPNELTRAPCAPRLHSPTKSRDMHTFEGIQKAARFVAQAAKPLMPPEPSHTEM